jgi:hypothetical protein
METSKALMKQAGILPKLKLGRKKEKGGVESTGPHQVRILEDKIVPGIDKETGKQIQEVKYTVEENGEKKEYRVPVKDKSGGLHYRVQRLSEIPDGGEVILEMKKRGIKNYVEVTTIGEVDYDETEADEPDDEPTVDISDPTEEELDEKFEAFGKPNEDEEASE